MPRTAICHTDGCTNADHAIEVVADYTDSETGETVPVTAVACGVCGQPITDLTPPLDQPLKESTHDPT